MVVYAKSTFLGDTMLKIVESWLLALAWGLVLFSILASTAVWLIWQDWWVALDFGSRLGFYLLGGACFGALLQPWSDQIHNRLSGGGEKTP